MELSEDFKRLHYLLEQAEELQEEGDWQLAFLMWEKAHALSKELNHLPSLAFTHAGLGSLLLDDEQYDMALEHFEQALALDEQLQNQDQLIDDHNNIGSVYYLKGIPYQAIRHFRLGIEIAEAVADPIKLAGCCWNLGMLYLDMKQAEQALPLIEQTYELLKDAHQMEIIRQQQVKQAIRETRRLLGLPPYRF